MTSFYVARPRRLRRQEQIGRSGWPEYPDYPSGDFVTFKITEVTDRKKYPETSTRRKLRIANVDGCYDYCHERADESLRGGYHTDVELRINLKTKTACFLWVKSASASTPGLNADVGNVVLLKTNFPDARYFVFAQSFFQMFASKSSMKYLQSSSQLF
jgi:hypothetical protein